MFLDTQKITHESRPCSGRVTVSCSSTNALKKEGCSGQGHLMRSGNSRHSGSRPCHDAEIWNWLFSNSSKGANASAIETAKANDFFCGMADCSRRAALNRTAPTAAPIGAFFLQVFIIWSKDITPPLFASYFIRCLGI